MTGKPEGTSDVQQVVSAHDQALIDKGYVPFYSPNGSVTWTFPSAPNGPKTTNIWPSVVLIIAFLVFILLITHSLPVLYW